MEQERGFSLLEIVIAILIITIGLIGLASTLVVGVTLPQRSRQQEIAKQLANEIMESIIFAKEAAPAGFGSFDDLDYIANGGRFLDASNNVNAARMLETGPDGVYGTCDDGQPPGAVMPCTGQVLGNRLRQFDSDPGPDGQYATTGNNRTIPLLNFSRNIIIKNLNGPPVTTREITVEVTYQTATGTQQKVSLTCRLTNFRTL